MCFCLDRIYILETAQVSVMAFEEKTSNIHIRMPYRPQLSQRILRQLEQRPSILSSRLLRRNIKHKKRQRRPIVLFHATPYIPDDLIIECGSVCRTEGELVADLEGECDSGRLECGGCDIPENVHAGWYRKRRWSCTGLSVAPDATATMKNALDKTFAP